MKSIYESAKSIIEGNYKGTNVPKSNFNRVSIAPQQSTVGQPNVEPISPFPQVRGTTRNTGGGALSKIKSVFSRAAELEKTLTANPLPNNPPAPSKAATQELPSVTTSNSGSEKIPSNANVPAYIRQNKPEPELKDMSTPAVFKTNPDREAQQKAKELMDKMDQMQQQGIGQTKPKVSADYYKNLKAIGMKPANESRMSSPYSVIRRILGEAKPPRQYSEEELQAMRDKRHKELEAKGLSGNDKMRKDEEDRAAKADANANANKKSDKTTSTSTITRATDKLPGSTIDNNGNKQPALVIPKSLTDRIANDVPWNSSQQVKHKQDMSKNKLQAAVVPTPAKPTGPETSGPDLNAMKSGIASMNKPIQYGLKQKAANAPLEAKREAEKNAGLNQQDKTTPVEAKPEAGKNARVLAPLAPEVEAKPAPTVTHTEVEPVETTNNVAAAPNAVEVPDHKEPPKPETRSVTPAEPAKQPEADAKPQASASEFKFSPEQEKWLGKANRQDPYILNRMPGEKPPVDYFKDPKDQELARKINIGDMNLKKIKGVLGMKESINQKFNVSDALYQSVMEVMKKDKKEGSIPRNDKEKELAAAYGDPKRITHGDVLKMRGVTKEEVAPKKASPGWGKDDYKPLVPDTEKPGSARVSPAGSTTKPDPKGKMKPSSGDPEGVKESKDTPGNSYEHQCAIHVKSESYGEGRTITTQHADPDADGNIAWYDVMFEHGIEKHVPTSTLEILVSENHMHMKKKKM